MNTNYIKVKDHNELVRDKRNKAILNVDKDELDKYKQDRDYRMKMKKMVEEHDQLIEKVNRLERIINDNFSSKYTH